MSPEFAAGLTYQVGWDWFIEPELKRQKALPATATQRPEMSGAWSPENATAEEANAFFDQLCGKRVHTGPRFWVPGEVPGVTVYRGPGK